MAIMPSLPIPLFVALTLGFLLVRSLRRGGMSRWLAALLLALAGQSVIVALVQHYGLMALRPVQPVTAAIIPPLAWLAFQRNAMRGRVRSADAAHLLGPGFIIFCVCFSPQVIDIALIMLFAGYGAALLISLHGQPELPLTRLAAGHSPALIWRVIALALIASAFSDLLIVAALSFGQAWLQPWILGAFSSAALLVIGLLSLSPDLDAEPEPEDSQPLPDPETDRQDADMIARLETLLTQQRVYLDPDLTLARLARRIGVPAKQLSAAVNRRTGDNVSRYINGFRIDHACAELASGANVTAAMLASGFNTKSNFNREFLRVTGHTPSDWKRASQPGAAP